MEATDTAGNTYSRNKRIECFDRTRPTLNSAVNNGVLTVQATDDKSGIRAVYVNGFEFTEEVTNGTLVIRMQQFDTGYQYFTVQAIDNAGNMSESYRVKNPYYKDKTAKSGSSGSNENKPVLPASAEPTQPSSAVAQVTEHIKTDADGITKAVAAEPAIPEPQGNAGPLTPVEEKKKSFQEADRQEEEQKETVSSQGGSGGREFYTIEARSGKVFYLVIDRKEGGEKAYFLTEITENDLLNVTEGNSALLPQNTAVIEGEAGITESGLPESESQFVTKEEKESLDSPDGLEIFLKDDSDAEDTVISENEPETGENEGKEHRPATAYLIIGVLAILAIIAGYCFKVARRSADMDYAEVEEDGDGYDELPEDDDYQDENSNGSDANPLKKYERDYADSDE